MGKSKYIATGALVLAMGAFMFPRGGQSPSPEHVSPAAELSMKQQTLTQDVSLTDQLCRTQCSLSFKQALQSASAGAGPKQALAELQKEHPHMQQLIWSKRGEPVDNGVAVGKLDAAVADKVRGELDQAKQRADAGQSYQSAPIASGGHTYMVLSEPGQDGSSIVGVVQQTILQEVENHQRKNLRMEAYPPEGKYKVESVDTDTLHDKTVDHPEKNEGTSHYHTNEVVVRFNNEPTEQQLAQMQAEIGATGHRKIGYTYVFISSHMEAKQLMGYFQRWNVAYVEPHYLYMTNEVTPASEGSAAAGGNVTGGAGDTVPNDSLYRKYQWNLPIIDTEKGWSITKGSKDIVVAVIDTGADLTHPDLQNQLVPGLNVVDPNADPQDDVGHGTHVAGVIAALTNNNLGVAGMSWYNKIMPVKALDSSGAGSTYSVAQGIIWAVDHGAKVINMSLGNYADANFLHDAIKYAFDHDVVMIAASGNDNTDRPGYPAAYPEVFAVAATDPDKNKASFSNYGDYIDVAAPGVTIASTYPHNQYAALSGTSMASPHVTALAALIRSANPQLKNTEVMDIMRKTAQDIGPRGKDSYFGYGLIDVVQALETAASGNQPKSDTTAEQPVNDETTGNDRYSSGDRSNNHYGNEETTTRNGDTNNNAGWPQWLLDLFRS